MFKICFKFLHWFETNSVAFQHSTVLPGFIEQVLDPTFLGTRFTLTAFMIKIFSLDDDGDNCCTNISSILDHFIQTFNNSIINVVM